MKCLVSAAHCKVDHCRDDEHCQKASTTAIGIVRRQVLQL